MLSHSMSPLPSIMRRFSRSSSTRKSHPPQSPTFHPNQNTASGPGGSGPAVPSTPTKPSIRDQALGDEYMVLPQRGGVANQGRPISSATDASFDFASRPVSNMNTSGGGSRGAMSSQTQQAAAAATGNVSLSRTDQIVLKHFWESKYQENAKRDLHYLKFPYFPQFPGHTDLLPYCEIYHLVKTSPGANIISLGSANGVYIGFELQTGSQLHIDLDDDWFTNGSATSITHHRIVFRPYASMLSDPNSATVFKTWPKPLTIEFLEEQYQAWCHDLTSPCWEAKEVRELAANGNGGGGGGAGGDSDVVNNPGHGHGHGGTVPVSNPGADDDDDGYVSEGATDHGI